MLVFEIIPALLFILSSGLLFQDRFRENRWMVAFASVVALVASYFLFEQITDRLAPSKVEAKEAPKGVTVAMAPTAAGEDGLRDLTALRDAINGLSDNTTDERLHELFGAPAERTALKGETYRGQEMVLERYAAGPYSLYVVKAKAEFIGYGIARASEPAAKGRTPLIFLSQANGWKNLEELTIGTVKGSCDPVQEGEAAATLAPVPEGGTAQLAATPKCYFGRPGNYAHYAFVYAMGGAALPGKDCEADYASIDSPGAFSKLSCAAYLDRKPEFVFMTRKDDVDVQHLTAQAYGALF